MYSAKLLLYQPFLQNCVLHLKLPLQCNNLTQFQLYMNICLGYMSKISKLFTFVDSSLKRFCCNAIWALNCHYKVLWEVILLLSLAVLPSAMREQDYLKQLCTTEIITKRSSSLLQSAISLDCYFNCQEHLKRSIWECKMEPLTVHYCHRLPSTFLSFLYFIVV